MDKKIFIAIGLSLATVWVFNYYVSKKVQPEKPGVVAVGGQKAAPVPGQPIKVASNEDLSKPLALDVDFADKKLGQQETVVSVETDYCQANLSTYGAVLTNLDFKEHHGKAGTPLRTVYNKGVYDEEQRKKGCFLVALDKQTPYVYSFVEKRNTDKKIEVVFKTENESWIITKTYSFHRDSYQIDLMLALASKTNEVQPVKPRIFFAAPFVNEIADDAATIVNWNEQKQSLETSDAAATQGLAWFWTNSKPLFGAQDRYFVNALINDPAKFVQRAYVKQFDPKNIYPVLEGPEILSGKAEWQLSFYMGPKLTDHLNYVDDRLEDVLSFGWLSWLCKLLLKLLAYIYGFIGNYGWAIIIMTILLKLPFTPLSIYSRKQMEIYQHYLPSINKIRTKYRQDMQMQHAELMKFYKDHNISPSTHFVGCLPLLIQMPILFALYRVLNNYLDLYQAPFIGWITDLSSKDPYYVIPILMGISMLWQQQMTPVSDGKQKVVMIFMSIFMTVLFANFPVGLVLYWFMNNLLTIGEDYIRKIFFK